MSEYETFGSTLEYVSRMGNSVECPCCSSVVDAQMLTSNYWGFTNIGSGNVKCNVCLSVIPAIKTPPNRRD